MLGILKVTVWDQHGVLDRITGLIRRNGWNIRSLNTVETKNGLHAIHIWIGDKSADLQKLGRALDRLSCVNTWEVCAEEDYFIRELLIAKLASQDFGAAEGLNYRISRLGEDVYLECTAFPFEIDRLLGENGPAILDYTRAGVLVLKKEAV